MRLTSASRISSRRAPASQHQHPRPRSHPSTYSRRSFCSTSVVKATHYETLSVPQDATKSQIKSSFYRLSKKYHPDVNKEAGARELFHKCSEAYTVLADDRNRRAYDRSLISSGRRSPYSSSSGSADPYTHAHYAYAHRHRGATHAWENARRQHSQYQTHSPFENPFSRVYQQQQQQQRQQQRQGPDPFSSPYVRRATGTTQHQNWSRGRPEQRDEDRIHEVSHFWRAMQVAGMVLVVSMVGGGWSANA